MHMDAVVADLPGARFNNRKKMRGKAARFGLYFKPTKYFFYFGFQ